MEKESSNIVSFFMLDSVVICTFLGIVDAVGGASKLDAISCICVIAGVILLSEALRIQFTNKEAIKVYNNLDDYLKHLSFDKVGTPDTLNKLRMSRSDKLISFCVYRGGYFRTLKKKVAVKDEIELLRLSTSIHVDGVAEDAGMFIKVGDMYFEKSGYTFPLGVRTQKDIIAPDKCIHCVGRNTIVFNG